MKKPGEHPCYILGEDPAQSDPDLPELRETLSRIDFVIVQDIFFNQTCKFADVIFPATASCNHETTRLPTGDSNACANS